MKNNNSKLSKNYVMIPLALLCCFLWGSAFPMVKIGYRLFSIAADDSFSQILFAGLRFSIAGILVIIFGSAASKKALVPKNKKEILHCFILCIFQTVLQYTAFYIGLAHTSGVKSSILVSTNVFFSLIISALCFKMEKLTLAKTAGVLIGFIGVVVINLTSGGFSGGFALNGEGAIMFSALSYSVSGVLIKKYSQSENPVMLSGWQFLTGGVIMMLTGALFGGRINSRADLKTVCTILYLALISAVAYTVWSLLLRYNPVSKVAVMGFTNPIFGVLLSALILGEASEAFSVKNLFSLILVCVGIYIVNVKTKNKKTNPLPLSGWILCLI